jgi:hypothetical protein
MARRKPRPSGNRDAMPGPTPLGHGGVIVVSKPRGWLWRLTIAVINGVCRGLVR